MLGWLLVDAGRRADAIPYVELASHDRDAHVRESATAGLAAARGP